MTDTDPHGDYARRIARLARRLVDVVGLEHVAQARGLEAVLTELVDDIAAQHDADELELPPSAELLEVVRDIVLVEDPASVIARIPADKWAATVTDTPPVELTPGELALAFDVSRDGAWSTIAVAAGTVRSSYVEVIEQWHELTELREHPGHGRPLVAIEAPADGTTIELEDDRAAEAPIEFRGYMIERTAAAQADEGAWWVDDGMAVEFFDSPLDAAAFIGQREVAPSVVASIDANRWMEAERDVERAARERAEAEARQLREAIRAHENLHRPDGPDGADGPIEMDGWPCCNDDRLLWAAAVAEVAEDRGQTDG